MRLSSWPWWVTRWSVRPPGTSTSPTRIPCGWWPCIVRPEHRGQGYAVQLLDGVVADARERGFDRVLLDVVDTNTPARWCYLRYGFRPTGVVAPLPHAPQHTETEMVLTLRR